MNVRKTVIAVGVTIAAAGWAQCASRAVALGLDPESNTDGFNPAAEAFQAGEARRLTNIARQFNTVYRMQWEHPYFLGEPPVRQPIGYESKQVAPNHWIYRPLYPEDVAPPGDSPETLPPPITVAPRAKPQAPGPADARPGDMIPPKNPSHKPASKGPREF